MDLGDEEEEAAAGSQQPPAATAAADGGSGAAAAAAAALRIGLVFRCQALTGGVQSMTINISKTDQLDKAFKGFVGAAVEAGWLRAGTAPRFQVDGDDLQPSSRPADLDLDDGDIIDVV